MILSYYGHSCFKLEYKIGGKNISCVIDPYSPDLGYTLNKISADFAIISHQHYDHNYIDAISFKDKNNAFIIDSAGEYEIKNIFVQGISASHDKNNELERGKVILFKILAEDISVAHLSDLGNDLTSEQLDLLENVDVLLLPVGGNYTIDAKIAVKVMNQIEAKIVIPMHYKLEKTLIDIDPIDNFLKELGITNPDSIMQENLKLKKTDLTNETTEIKILKPLVK